MPYANVSKHCKKYLHQVQYIVRFVAFLSTIKKPVRLYKYIMEIIYNLGLNLQLDLCYSAGIVGTEFCFAKLYFLQILDVYGKSKHGLCERKNCFLGPGVFNDMPSDTFRDSGKSTLLWRPEQRSKRIALKK